jgi:hypothetical protein
METLGDIPLIQVGKFQWVLRPCLVRKRVPGAGKRANTDRLFLTDAQWHDLSREVVRHLESKGSPSESDLHARAALHVLRERSKFGHRAAMSIDKRFFWNLNAIINSGRPTLAPQLPTEPKPLFAPDPNPESYVPWYTKVRTWLWELVSEPVGK